MLVTTCSEHPRRRRTILLESNQVYTEAGKTEVLASCPRCKDHQTTVFADGSTFCQINEEYIVAPSTDLVLTKMRLEYERRLLKLANELDIH